MRNDAQMIEDILRDSGKLILKDFGSLLSVRKKRESSQIVTEVDIATERIILSAIEKAYPRSSILAEESGFLQKDPNDIWVIDPIDGTSNFSHGLPWFGVMIARMIQGEVTCSGIYLPTTEEMYIAQKGKGAWKNGKKFFVKEPQKLSLSLIAFGTDGSENAFTIAQKAKVFFVLLPKVLNIRMTNSAVDYVYTAEGKISGLISLENKIWDIAPIYLIAKEAGCVVTNIFGESIDFRLDPSAYNKNFNIVFAHMKIHTILIRLINAAFG